MVIPPFVQSSRACGLRFPLTEALIKHSPLANARKKSPGRTAAAACLGRASGLELAARFLPGRTGQVARAKTDRGVKVLLRGSQIRRRVRELAREMERDYKGEAVHLICILKGACVFLADLLRELKLPVSVDFIAVSSYGKGSLPSGEVRITKDLDHSVEGLNVIIVEDILDTGLTLNYLYRILESRKPRSLRIATLLDKPARRVKEVKVDYVGFQIPDKFVVGYGLDYGERYRNLPDVCVLSSVES
ncbi:MAG: hypoxanthine phosphoribosyltransferase [Acidobacteria bacterium]|nr:hypoxanthine phosphoribosyltransferase [Acidobacteriota bacterium]